MRLGELTAILLSALGIGIGLSIFQMVIQDSFRSLDFVIKMFAGVIALGLPIYLLVRIFIRPLKYHKDFVCTLLFDQTKMEFVNPGWYEKFYLPQYGSTEFDEAIWADKTKSIRFIDGMLENNPSEIKQLAEFLILFWIRTEGIQGVFSCGPIKTHYFENLPNWLKGNFPEFMKSSNLNDGKIPQGLVVLTPKDFNLKSDILGNIKFVSSWAELSITAEPLSIWPQRMMRHFQNYDLISDIPFTKTFSEDLRKMLPIVSISISFRTEVWISRPYWVFMRKRSDRLASCIEKLEKSFRCSMDVRSTQIY